MGYYSPSFAALDQGWYSSTNDVRYASERDACLQWWTDECDQILASFVHRYGMFFRAFSKDIAAAISERRSDEPKFPSYFEYFLTWRVLENPSLAAVYRADYESRSKQSVTCVVCGAIQLLDDLHPSLIGRAGRVLPVCNTCGFWVAHFCDLRTLPAISVDLIARIRGLAQAQSCAACRHTFTWVSTRIRYAYDVPLLPKRHTQICPRCIGRAISGSPLTDPTLALAKLKRIGEILRAIPEKSAFVFDYAPTLAGAVEIISLLKAMPPVDKLGEVYGSWFKALIAAGILPEGSRKTQYGTMVIANDGHECLSLAEKTVDDLFSQHDIPHEKEVPYPSTKYRADWRIVVNGIHVYVELFGLDGQPNYTRRMTQKVQFAQQAGIRLVSFTRRDLGNLRRSFEEKILCLFQPSSTD